MILILADPKDAHAAEVATRLRERGEKIFSFDPSRFPEKAHLSVSIDHGRQLTYVLTCSEKKIHLEEVTAIWLWHPPMCRSTYDSGVNNIQIGKMIEAESLGLLKDMWNALDCAWFPANWQVIKKTSGKIYQLKVANDVGFTIPETLLSNHPNDVLDLYRENDGQIISKLAAFGFHNDLVSYGRYTDMVTTRDICRFQDISLCPMIFQPYIKKAVEIRVTVVGSDVFAAEIQSQKSNRSKYDWRHYDFSRTPYATHKLPQHVENLCRKYLEKLELRYGAIDLILTPDDEYIFLELNPVGRCAWIEIMTGMPITECICDQILKISHE